MIAINKYINYLYLKKIFDLVIINSYKLDLKIDL